MFIQYSEVFLVGVSGSICQFLVTPARDTQPTYP